MPGELVFKGGRSGAGSFTGKTSGARSLSSGTCPDGDVAEGTGGLRGSPTDGFVAE